MKEAERNCLYIIMKNTNHHLDYFFLFSYYTETLFSILPFFYMLGIQHIPHEDVRILGKGT